MNARILQRFLGIAVAVILLLVARLASAQMPEERTIVRAGWDRGPVVQVGPGTSAQQVIDYFAVDYLTTTGSVLTRHVLFDANPRGTIATCAFRTDGQPTFDPRNPHDESVWGGCEPSKKGIALVAGAYLRVPMEKAEEPVKGDDFQAAYDHLTHELGCDRAGTRYGCAKKKIAELKKAPPSSSPPVEPKAPETQNAPDGILAKVVEQRDAAMVEVVVLTTKLETANVENAALTTALGTANAELAKRPSRDRWLANVLILGALFLAFGIFIGVEIMKHRNKRGPPKSPVSTEGAFKAATLPSSGPIDRTAKKETQKRIPRPTPPPTG